MLGTRPVNTVCMRHAPTSVIGWYALLILLPLAAFDASASVGLWQWISASFQKNSPHVVTLHLSKYDNVLFAFLQTENRLHN